MQVFTDDFNIGTLAAQVFLGVLDHLLTMRVVLVEQKDFFNLRHVLDEGGHGFHLHRGVSVKAEVPIAAFAVGEIGVHCRVVEENDFLARVAFIVFVHGVKQRTCN